MELIVSADLLAGRARAAVREGVRAHPMACAAGPAGAREPALIAYGPWRPGEPAPFVRLAVQHAPHQIRRRESWRFLAERLHPLAAGTGVLWLGGATEAGEFVGVVNAGDGVQPLTALRLVGPGLDRVWAAGFAGPPPASAADELRWSRHAGALDRETWLRQRALRAAVVGVGRMGSVVAGTLARWGASFALVDADLVEPHNLDASDALGPADVGRPKAAAVAQCLRRQGAGGSIDAVVATVAEPAGRAALANAEVVACCVDNDATRAFVGAWARRYGLVLLDLGTGVHREGARWRAGADIRLILPGDGCLLCWGGLADAEARGRATDWRAERAGSLRTLNATAAHLGLTLLEQLLFARLQGSTWLRLEIDDTGVPGVTRITPPARGDCPGCAETFRGAGADGNELSALSGL